MFIVSCTLDSENTDDNMLIKDWYLAAYPTDTWGAGCINPDVKFKDWTTHSADGSPVTLEEKEARALEIANKLSDNNVWKSHGRPIGIQVLTEDLHLKIIDYEQDSELNDIISEYYDALSEYIRSHNYSGFFQTRLFI